MSRAHNFSAGPAVLPLSVIEELKEALAEFGGTRCGLMEISHRGPAFSEVMASALARIRRLMDIPEDYEVLFLQGGASLQFYMSPLNLTGPEDRADYVLTGVWSNKAIKEAQRVCHALSAWDGKVGGFKSVPQPGEVPVHEEAAFLHYTSNNTIYGTGFLHEPAEGIPLVVDMSSDICGRVLDVSRHAVVYAGAQKNLGPSGVTAVILSPWAVDRARTFGAARPGGLPSMLNYGLMVDKGSMFNTPNTFGIFALERVLAWLEAQGGVAAMEAKNRAKADTLYAVLDASDFWRPHAEADSRSIMNITWRMARPELEPRFLQLAAEEGLMALRGHRSIGGIRASIYNACEQESVDALAGFMADFERYCG